MTCENERGIPGARRSERRERGQGESERMQDEAGGETLRMAGNAMTTASVPAEERPKSG